MPFSPLEVESPTPSAYYPLHMFLQHEHATEDPEILADIDTSSVESDNIILNSPSSAQPVALPPSFFVADTSHQRAHSYEHRHRKSYKSRMLGTKLQLYQRRREKTHKCPVRSHPRSTCFLTSHVCPFGSATVQTPGCSKVRRSRCCGILLEGSRFLNLVLSQPEWPEISRRKRDL